MPKHNEDFSNAEQEEKNKFHGGQDLVPGALDFRTKLLTRIKPTENSSKFPIEYPYQKSP